MRTLILVTMLAATAAAQTTSPASASSPATPPAISASADQSDWLPPATGQEDATQKKARAILIQMIEALGGKAYMEINDTTQVGRTYGFSRGQPASFGFVYRRYTQFPDKDRTEIAAKRDVIVPLVGTVPGGSEDFLVYVANGDKGFETTYKGTTLQDPKRWRDFVLQRQHSLPVVLRIWLKKPGTMVLYDGTAIAEQRMTDKISILTAENESVTLFIDQSSHLPLKKTFTHRNPLDRLKDEYAEIFANYRVVQGINTPHTLVTSRNGEFTNQRFVKTVTYNDGLQESMFQATATYDPYVHERRNDRLQQQSR